MAIYQAVITMKCADEISNVPRFDHEIISSASAQEYISPYRFVLVRTANSWPPESILTLIPNLFAPLELVYQFPLSAIMSTVNMVKYYFYKGKMPKNPTDLQHMVALAYQTARDMKLYSRAILIR
jgi:hypothetical protein